MKLELYLPDSVLLSLRKGPDELPSCLRLMASAKLYEMGRLSQEQAAELSGLNREEFHLALSEIGISPFQGVDEDLAAL